LALIAQVAGYPVTPMPRDRIVKLVEAIPVSKSFINMARDHPYNVPVIDNTGIWYSSSRPQSLREKRKPRRFDGN
jgi:hypothetical protein